MEDFKCLIGLHHLVKDKEETVTDARGNVIGKVIISYCTNCGKIKSTYIRTVEGWIEKI